jgi:hypothetical protein
VFGVRSRSPIDPSPQHTGRRCGGARAVNGTELTGIAILRWSQEARVEWHYIAPGKPQQSTHPAWAAGFAVG